MLIIIGAFIRIPVPVCPFTLQFLFTMLAGLLMGAKKGAASVGLYMLLGLAGLPVFTEGGGPGYLLHPSFGYIPGFCLGSYVTGRITEQSTVPAMPRLLAANFVGLAIVYGVGMSYYYLLCNYVIHTPIGVWSLFLYCFLLPVPGDIALCILAAVIAKRLYPALRGMGVRG